MATLAVTRRFDLTVEQGARLEPLLPCPDVRADPRKGRNGSSSLIDGIRQQAQVGAPGPPGSASWVGSWKAAARQAGGVSGPASSSPGMRSAARCMTMRCSASGPLTLFTRHRSVGPCGANRHQSEEIGRVASGMHWGVWPTGTMVQTLDCLGSTLSGIRADM